MQKNKKLGFSLIELMVVIAILSILVTIIFPSYRLYTRRAHYTEIIQAVIPYKLGVQECFETTGDLTLCGAGENGVPLAMQNTSEVGLVENIRVEPGGLITVTPKNKYGITEQDTYQLNPMINQEILSWKTSGGGVAQGYAK